jgi:hypothetical protein
MPRCKTYDASHARLYAPALIVCIKIGGFVLFATSVIVGTASVTDAPMAACVLPVGVKTDDAVPAVA